MELMKGILFQVQQAMSFDADLSEGKKQLNKDAIFSLQDLLLTRTREEYDQLSTIIFDKL